MMNIYTIVLSLLFVEEGYQYFHIDQKIYLVPQYHVIWMPSGKAHKITSEAQTVNLMVFCSDLYLKKNFIRMYRFLLLRLFSGKCCRLSQNGINL
ncbi:AraC family ligand binding domain-containing protein [Chryseobacterium indologenes]|uniref:AraC family ligand binding domain-containing protein n=1 Tax=Chryseobacterium indologenes TaxID=253 RepID=UPI001E3DD3C5|nr:AraC family ligand binding domain-containing protein [Chryseobacterium indologenes]